MMQVVKGHKFAVIGINSEDLKYSMGTIIMQCCILESC